MENNKHPELPAIQISKEYLKILSTLTPKEAGIILQSLFHQIYRGIEPSFDERYLLGLFECILSYVEDRAEKYESVTQCY